MLKYLGGVGELRKVGQNAGSSRNQEFDWVLQMYITMKGQASKKRFKILLA
jgi:hypothetical protein